MEPEHNRKIWLVLLLVALCGRAEAAINDKGCGHQDLSQHINGLDGVKWPWMASIGHSSGDGSWEHFCGGTLIDHNLVLTSAHCVQPAMDNSAAWIIRLGDIENEELVEHKIRKIYIHPDYLLGQAYYDLAMIRVDYVDYSSTISPICLSVRPDSTGIRFVGKSVTVAGWEGFNGSNATLETSPMTVLPLRYCNRIHINIADGQSTKIARNYLPRSFQPVLLCGRFEVAKQGTCQGDSGSPLMMYNPNLDLFFQIGLAAGGITMDQCGANNYPAVFTSLNHPKNLDFIKSTAEKSENEETTNREDSKLKSDSIKEDGVVNGTDKITFPKDDASNRDFYVGEVKDNQPHGKGKMVWKNGRVYDGQWEKGVENGMGKTIFPDGEAHEGAYKNGVLTGHVKQTFAKDDELYRVSYIGDFKDNQFHGKGKIVWTGGFSYDGDWVNGVQTGVGIEDYGNGDFYEGGFKDNVRSGKGKLTYATGVTVVGDFVNGLANGFAQVKFGKDDERDSYIGETKDNKRHGEGKLVWKNGKYYIGGFEAGSRHGYGTLYSAKDEIIYQGQWSNDIRT